jgi:hypothetical protein
VDPWVVRFLFIGLILSHLHTSFASAWRKKLVLIFDFVILVHWVLVAIDILTYQVVFSGLRLYILFALVDLS